MTLTQKLLLIVALIIATTMWAMSPTSVTYRLTLRTDVAGHQASGSELVQVNYQKVPRFFGSTATGDVWASGQAAHVDLGGRGLLVALLGGSGDLNSAPEYVIPRAFGLKNGDDLSRLRGLEGSRVLSQNLLPPLVYFSNPLDPSTAKLLSARDLESTFAPQVKFLGAELEIVKLPWPPSWFGLRGKEIASIEEKLPWLKDASQQSVFWKALIASGWHRSAEVTTLFIRR